MSSNEVVLLVIFSVPLLVNGISPKRHWTLLPNVLVLDVDGQQGQYSLPCLESKAEMTSRSILDQNIIWKKNGADTPTRGNTFPVQLEESFGGGNYTCNSEDGTLLNNTLVLLRQEKAKTDQGDLKCTAQNYNGSFHCSWKYPKRRVWTVALVKAQRGQSWTCFSGEGNIHCDLDSGGDGITCRETCPQPEESRLLHVTVYVHTEYYLLETYYLAFYLTEIVKPDKVNIQKVNETMVEWRYPGSWSIPHSYYPLISQVAVGKDCRECGNPCTDLTSGKIVENRAPGMFQFEIRKTKYLCVRIRDPFSPPQWSDWSRHRVKRQPGKNKNKVGGRIRF
ncbi:unnamed protein product [Lota lota]